MYPGSLREGRANGRGRDTWEMDALQVAFRNPEWEPWLQGVVQHVCAELGVNTAASQPRAELYKLLLYETGSQ
jgi:hypothetical protein